MHSILVLGWCHGIPKLDICWQTSRLNPKLLYVGPILLQAPPPIFTRGYTHDTFLRGRCQFLHAFCKANTACCVAVMSTCWTQHQKLVATSCENTLTQTQNYQLFLLAMQKPKTAFEEFIVSMRWQPISHPVLEFPMSAHQNAAGFTVWTQRIQCRPVMNTLAKMQR